MGVFIVIIVGLFIYFIRIESCSVRMERWRQRKAICKKFHCRSNEFTYVLENDSGDYIVSLKDEEYRVKFSLSRPIQIVFCQSVERVEG